MSRHLFAAALLFTSLAVTRADPPARPNILFAVADDMSHASAYGYSFLSTPNFDSVAKAGVQFTRMYTPSSKCAPSRAVMLTGRNPWQLEEAANHKCRWPVKFKSVVETLADHGYFTGFTGKGWNPGIHPPGRHLTGTPYNTHTVELRPDFKCAAYDYAANFRAFYKAKPDDRPFFFWYGSKEPHRGYAFRSGVNAGKRLEDLDFLPSFWGDSETVKHDILDYALEVEYFDQHLGAILRHLEEQGELENTLVICTSDNAMPFPRFKGHPHEFATRVPFAVNWPGRITHPGRKSHAFASFIDLAPTVLEAAGIPFSESGMQSIQGKSLFDVFADAPSGRERVITGRERNDMAARPNGESYPVRSLHRGEWIYLHNFEPDRWPCGTEEGDFKDTDASPTKGAVRDLGADSMAFAACFGKRPREELYHIRTDPECMNNLALNPEAATRLNDMKAELFEELRVQDDPRMGQDGSIFDRYDNNPERITRMYNEQATTVRKRNRKRAKQ